MPRFTKRISEDCIELSGKCNPKYNGHSQRIYKEHEFWTVFEALCKKEEAEENGLTASFPCSIGSNIFTVETWNEPKQTDVFTYVFDGIEKNGLRLKDPDNEEYVTLFSFDDLGKTVFLSETAATKAKEEYNK